MVNLLPLVRVATLSVAAAASPLARRRSDPSPIGFNSNINASPALKAALTGAVSYSDRQAILFTNPPDASNITFTFINNTVTDGDRKSVV